MSTDGSEFGHFAYIGNGFCLDSWGAGPFVLHVGTKAWRFEDSDRFGPLIITKRGAEASVQPGERSPFWQAHMAWRKQGRRLAEDGITCIYDPLKPTLYRKVGRKNIIVQHGDEGGGYEEVQP
jgi:hypothetical protein